MTNNFAKIVFRIFLLHRYLIIYNKEIFVKTLHRKIYLKYKLDTYTYNTIYS